MCVWIISVVTLQTLQTIVNRFVIINVCIAKYFYIALARRPRKQKKRTEKTHYLRQHHYDSISLFEATGSYHLGQNLGKSHITQTYNINMDLNHKWIKKVPVEKNTRTSTY